MTQSQVLAVMSVQYLKGVGAALAEKLAKLGIRTVEDLLFHLPRDYEDRSRITPMRGLVVGQSVLLEGIVMENQVMRGRRTSMAVRITDDTASVTLRFYHFYPQQQQQLSPGRLVRVFGEVRLGSMGLEMYHPEFTLVQRGDPLPDATLTPLYPATDGVQQPKLRQLIAQALDLAAPDTLPELLPEHVSQRLTLLDALRTVHRPATDSPRDLLLAGRHPAQQRLAFEELTSHQVSLALRRQAVRAWNAPVFPPDHTLAERLLAGLPFALTGAQRRVWGELATDLARPRPMLRLVQGDVGAGKTVVAALAACQAVAAGWQVALMAPTEILAEQHFLNFSRWFGALDIPVAWLSGKQGVKDRRLSLEKVGSGEARVVVGTHALFQESVQFWQLGLVIIDEQHRFGVDQRLALREKGEQTGLCPHQLVMTATPIPRTLAMSAYGDLDTSVIDELPPNRTPVTTVALPNTRREELMARVRANCEQGRQAYWVCTLIEESEQLQAQAAEATFEELKEALPGLRLGLVHGRQKPAEKQAVMQAFKAGEIDLLVATTVIEVGVDVPNASLMVIENAERLGLSQLHQLRGRVGRGSAVSYCVLVYQPPLSLMGQQRLAILRETNDGFLIAEKDLELRGPGELLGTRQTGMVSFRVADLVRDQAMLKAAQHVGRELVKSRPGTAKALVQRWVPEGGRYGSV